MRLIDADKALEHIKKRLLETALNNTRVVCDAAYLYADISDNRIETWMYEVPAVDAGECISRWVYEVEEPTAKWELAEDGWYCSKCEMYPPFDCDPEEKGIPYCPWCGARMDGEDDGR